MRSAMVIPPLNALLNILTGVQISAADKQDVVGNGNALIAKNDSGLT
jgi:hypothetical protein